MRKDSQIEFRALARRDAENALVNELEKLKATAPEKEQEVSEWSIYSFPIRDVAYSLCPLLIIAKVQLHLCARACALLRLDKNNCLVPVTYGPEHRVGQLGKYLTLDKNF